MNAIRLLALLTLAIPLSACGTTAGSSLSSITELFGPRGQAAADGAVDVLTGWRDPRAAGAIVCELRRVLVASVDQATLDNAANGLESLSMSTEAHKAQGAALETIINDWMAIRRTLNNRCGDEYLARVPEKLSVWAAHFAGFDGGATP